MLAPLCVIKQKISWILGDDLGQIQGDNPPRAVDSLHHNLGTIKVGRVFIEKSFTYLGEGRVNISNIRTTDAYSSCSYSPREPLVKGKLYTLQSSLAFVAPCTFNMIHSVELGDGKNIIIRYTGIVVK